MNEPFICIQESMNIPSPEVIQESSDVMDSYLPATELFEHIHHHDRADMFYHAPLALKQHHHQ
jgi:hypothetical protein